MRDWAGTIGVLLVCALIVVAASWFAHWLDNSRERDAKERRAKFTECVQEADPVRCYDWLVGEGR